VVNVMDQHGHIDVPPPLHSLQGRLLDQSESGWDAGCSIILGFRARMSKRRGIRFHDRTEVHGFSALITGRAIVHTTGMPVAYSFGLGNVTHYVRLGTDVGQPLVKRSWRTSVERVGHVHQGSRYRSARNSISRSTSAPKRHSSSRRRAAI
jgi:hypothetical protein